MPPPSQPQAPASRWRGRRTRVVMLALFAVAILVAAGTVWYFFFRPAGPPPVGPGAPVIPPGAVSTISASPGPSFSPVP
ncbi:MAG TPA: hypothetical protein VJZ50_01050 [Candidatus Limnocylindrales bacterium]|nr:hypothetical protein [Candidatus Limnocylindrales bacterium]